MKSIHNVFLTKEKEKKLSSIGGRFGASATYNKDDYLTPNKVAKKFNISTEEAKTIMKNLLFKRTIFALNGRKAQMITRLGKSSGSALYLHPLALEAFQKHIGEQKD